VGVGRVAGVVTGGERRPGPRPVHGREATAAEGSVANQRSGAGVLACL
jgi:hypothetical protein